MVLVDLASFCGKTAQNRCWHSFQETRHGRQPSIASASRTLFSFLFSLFSSFFSLFSSLLPLVCCLFSILSLLNSLDGLDGPAGFARPVRRAGPPPWAAFPSAARRILHAIGRRHGRRRRWPTPAGSILPVCRKCCAGSSSPPVQSCQ